MGKLLDEVLRIHKSRINADISAYAIENNIISINKKIIACAENSKTLLVIDFITNDDTAIASAKYNEFSYDYNLQEDKSIPHIQQYLKKHYTNEGFEVRYGDTNFIIDWRSKLNDIE